MAASVLTINGFKLTIDGFTLRRVTDSVPGSPRVLDLSDRTITDVWDRAFGLCTSLGAVHLPAGLSVMGSSVFAVCSELSAIYLPAELTIIKDRTFVACASLREVHFPPGLEVIGESAFSGCKELREVHLPAGLMHIGDYAFTLCTNLREAHLPAGLTHIGIHAFSLCTNLREVYLPAGLRTIEDNAFSGCTNLARVTLFPCQVSYFEQNHPDVERILRGGLRFPDFAIGTLPKCANYLTRWEQAAYRKYVEVVLLCFQRLLIEQCDYESADQGAGVVDKPRLPALPWEMVFAILRANNEVFAEARAYYARLSLFAPVTPDDEQGAAEPLVAARAQGPGPG